MSNLFENTRREHFNIYDDWVFHYLYAQDTQDANQALIAVLNTILNRRHDPIVSVQIVDPEYFGEGDTKRESSLDIKAKTSSGELVDVEMQNGHLTYFGDRSVYYCAKMVNSSLDSGEDYDRMKKSIMIAIVNGKMFPTSDLLHTSFHYREDTEQFLLSDKSEIHFIELGKVDPDKPIGKMDPVEQFAAYVKYAGDPSKESLLQQLIDHGGEAITMTEKMFKELTDEERAYWHQESVERYKRDMLSLQAAAKREGIQEGVKQGIKEGILQIARNLKASGMSQNEIINLTNLTAEEISTL